MDMYSRRQYLKKLQHEYLHAEKTERTVILNEYVKNTGHNRKYVISQLNDVKLVEKSERPRKKRLCKYNKEVVKSLEKMYEIFDYPCGQRLKPLIENEVERLIRFKEIQLSGEQKKLLKTMSSATIDRKLKPVKKKHRKPRFSTTKPGTLLKHKIPIRLTEWDTKEVGFVEVDLVAHCGQNASGDFIHTVSLTEIATGWWEGEAIMNKGQKATFEAIKNMRGQSYFYWRGIDSDNGGEFINHILWRYCQKENIEFTRSRPYHKNDNAYVEQKNWTHVRQILGYARYDTRDELELINSLYQNELRLYKNFFQSGLKLKEKTRVGGKVKRKYEKAKTPYQRLMASSQVTGEQKEQLQKIYKSLNPAELKRNIEKKLFELHLINQAKSSFDNNSVNLHTENIPERKEVLVGC